MLLLAAVSCVSFTLAIADVTPILMIYSRLSSQFTFIVGVFLGAVMFVLQSDLYARGMNLRVINHTSVKMCLIACSVLYVLTTASMML